MTAAAFQGDSSESESEENTAAEEPSSEGPKPTSSSSPTTSSGSSMVLPLGWPKVGIGSVIVHKLQVPCPGFLSKKGGQIKCWGGYFFDVHFGGGGGAGP